MRGFWRRQGTKVDSYRAYLRKAQGLVPFPWSMLRDVHPRPELTSGRVYGAPRQKVKLIMSLVVTETPVAPKDKRFPSTNQATHCWNLYNEWVLCLKKNDGDETACYNARYMARSMCPNEWIENWDGQRDSGTFPGLK